MNEQKYRFLGERIADVLSQSLGEPIADEDAESAVREALHLDEPDHYGQLIAVESFVIGYAAEALVAELARSADVEVQRRRETLSALGRHEDCEGVIDDLLEERDDLIAGVQGARDRCFSDISVGEYGDLYVSVDDLLEAVRPNLVSDGALGRDRHEFDGDCAGCGDDVFHEAECPVESYRLQLEERSEHEIRSHRHCVEIATEVFAQIDAQRRHVEYIARLVRGSAHHTYYDGWVVAPHRILPALAGQPPAQAVPISSQAARIYPVLESVAYCSEDDLAHSAPHRACRVLVS